MTLSEMPEHARRIRSKLAFNHEIRYIVLPKGHKQTRTKQLKI